MTITLPLELAELPGRTPPPAVLQEKDVCQSSLTSKGQKARSGPKSTSKRKPTTARTSDPTGPVYQQFGNLPSNPTYHLARVGEAIRQARNVIVISGAGVSTPAIPDFRSSKGLFKTLADETRRKAMFSENNARDDEPIDVGEDTELDEAEDWQEGRERQRKPRARPAGTSSASGPSLGGMKSGKELFDVKCLTSPDLLPHHHNLLNHLTLLTSRTSPTPFHHYLKTLDDQGRLLRCYTQNIDGLEEKAGLDLRIPLEADFPKRRRTGMSRESSRKSDVFGKNNAKEEQPLPPSQSLAEDRSFGPDLLPLPTIPAVGPTVLQPLNHTTAPLAFGSTVQYYNPYQHPGSQQSYQLPLYPYIPAYRPEHAQHPVFDDFSRGNGASNMPDSSANVSERPYPAEVDPFCSYQAALTMAAAEGLSQLSSGSRALDSQQLEVGRGVATVRSGSTARSVSGTTDTSATSVSAKVDMSRDADTDKEAAAGPNQLPDPVSIARTTDFFVGTPASQFQSQLEPVNVPKLPRCVPLHGTLANLECTRCSFSQPLRDAVPLPLELMPCPSCEDAWEERVESSQRPRSIGFLRASVLLYGEEHKHGESIGAVVERDLLGRLKDERMDLLIVAGTTLQIPGVKRMIKEFAKALRTQAASKKKPSRKNTTGDNASTDKELQSSASSRSRTTTSLENDDNDNNEDEDFPIQTILLNRDPPGKGKGGEWANTFDVWVQGDLQEFVQQWVVEGPPSGEIPKSKEPEKTAVPPVVSTPSVKSRMEVTKVEGTKIHLTLEKSSASVTQSLPSQQLKRKQPPSPVKIAAKVKARGPKKSKAQQAITFPSKKPGIRASPQKAPPKQQLSSPETLSSGSERLVVLIPTHKPVQPAAVAPGTPVVQSTAAVRPVVAAVARPSTRRTRSQSSPPPTPALSRKAGKMRARPLRLPTRQSARHRNAVNESVSSSSFLPITPKKRTRGSASSSPLSSVPCSEDESAECSSQGVIERCI
ncbi:hypothetical protein QFC22_002647 [Naganishia vaughanmartiniae]|uniref:Uncharacterized protein n=1 Tax=Naganishia vaughanmartiniae TaxID=1424756 RepID=A0ACC2XCC3_9TREE|nr:hypothetical protein QFC22_002647 [Naganishia vaughanmartiniae]